MMPADLRQHAEAYRIAAAVMEKCSEQKGILFSDSRAFQSNAALCMALADAYDDIAKVVAQKL
jgi:hypothetical protein